MTVIDPKGGVCRTIRRQVTWGAELVENPSGTSFKLRSDQGKQDDLVVYSTTAVEMMVVGEAVCRGGGFEPTASSMRPKRSVGREIVQRVDCRAQDIAAHAAGGKPGTRVRQHGDR